MSSRPQHAARPTRRKAPQRRRRGPLLPLLALIATGVLVGIILGMCSMRTLEPAQTSSSSRQAGINDKTAASDVAPTPSEPITVAAVGDMIFDRNVGALIDARGGSAPLSNVSSTLAAADVTVGNLESTLSDRGTADADKDVVLRGRLAGIQGLAASDFSAVSLANNHTLDYGSEALQDTIAALDKAGIKHAGAGMSAAEATAPAIIEARDKTIAFLSYSDILPEGFVATQSSPGIAAARTDMDAVTQTISALKQQYDFVLVSFHWGVEYEDYIIGDQELEAHAAIDAGADAVLSEHPHVIQGIEFYQDKLIAYSLGDFVFDHYSRKTGESFILQFELGDEGVTDVTATPTYLDEYGAPSVVTGDEAQAILSRLEEISAGMNSSFTIIDDVAHISPITTSTGM